jgi:hypothetical protein
MPEEIPIEQWAHEPAEPFWEYNLGLPVFETGPMAKYLHLARWRHDPTERLGRGGETRAEHRGQWVAALGDREWWATRIEALLLDGRPRTYNAVCVQLEGVNSDAMFLTTADEALWYLVARKRVGWVCRERCVFFLHAHFIDGGDRTPEQPIRGWKENDDDE